MLGVTLAAASALSYGASDFSGAIATKGNDAKVVTLIVQAVSLVALVIIVVTFPPAAVTVADLGWGVVGGLGAAVGLVTFYRALALGPMSVAAAITALCGSVIPIAAGLALGDRPGSLTLLGVVLAIPAGVLASAAGNDNDDAETADHPADHAVDHPVDPATDHGTQTGSPSAGSQARTRRLAVVAGIGFGLFLVALSRTSADAGLFPLVGARMASIAGLAVAIGWRGTALTVPVRWWPTLMIGGLLDCAANSLFLSALRFGDLTWVAAISSLYPISTVLLARSVLGERMVASQRWGMVAAAGSLVLVGVGAST